MKNKLIAGSFSMLMIWFSACQKNEGEFEYSQSSDLYTSVAEIVGTQMGDVTTDIEQGVSVEQFNGQTDAYIISGSGYPGNFGMPGWRFSIINSMRFGFPHLDSCIIVSVSGSSYPREIVIEFPGNCTNARFERKGKIIINISDTLTNEGAVETIVYQDFYIDSIKIDLNARLENMGMNDAGNWVIKKTSVQTITKGDDIIVRENNESIEWLSGFTTPVRRDNIFLISGSGTIVVNGTARYSRNITTPLLHDASCEFIKSGVVELTRNGNVTVIDFGDGTCDDKATVTSNGTTEEINLHSRKFRIGGRFNNLIPVFGNWRNKGH